MEINGIEMITDRTMSDVELVKSLVKKGLKRMTDDERRSFLSGMKGAYSYTDFNRVESVVKYLSDRLVKVPVEIDNLRKELNIALDSAFSVPYDPSEYENINVKTDWEVSNILTETDRVRYIGNIKHIVLSLSDLPESLPMSLDGLTHSGANAIEQSLVNLDMLLTELKKSKETLLINTSKAMFYSGEIYGGEV